MGRGELADVKAEKSVVTVSEPGISGLSGSGSLPEQAIPRITNAISNPIRTINDSFFIITSLTNKLIQIKEKVKGIIVFSEITKYAISLQ